MTEQLILDQRLDAAKHQTIRILVRYALEAERWNVTRAAARLGMRRTYLHRLMREHGIRRPAPKEK